MSLKEIWWADPPMFQHEECEAFLRRLVVAPVQRIKTSSATYGSEQYPRTNDKILNLRISGKFQDVMNHHQGYTHVVVSSCMIFSQ